MAWEIIQRREGCTLWGKLDAEGREVWDITRDRNGVAVEPVGQGYAYINVAKGYAAALHALGGGEHGAE